MQSRVAREDPVEDLGLAAHVELRGRLVEQHHAGAEPHGAQRTGQRDALPLPAGEIGAARVATRQDRVEIGETGRAGLLRARRRITSSPAPCGATLSRNDSS